MIDSLQLIVDRIANINIHQLYDQESTLKSLERLKKFAVQDNDQYISSFIWCLEQAVRVHSYYIESFDLLKCHQFYDAWCALEKTEKGL